MKANLEEAEPILTVDLIDGGSKRREADLRHDDDDTWLISSCSS